MRNDEAVSAVIGVILMVAITVSIAATFYVMMNGMLSSSVDMPQNIQFIPEKNSLLVVETDEIMWKDVWILGNTTAFTINGKNYTEWNQNQTVEAGDLIDNLHGNIRISIHGRMIYQYDFIR